MVNLKSQPAIRRRAVDLLDSYATWVDGTATPRLTRGRAGVPSVIELDSVATTAAAYGDAARVLLAEPEIAEIEQAILDDLNMIASQSALAIAELSEATDPDAIWNGLPPHEKKDKLQRHPIDTAKADRILARLKLEIAMQDVPNAAAQSPGSATDPSTVVAAGEPRPMKPFPPAEG